ncbi:FAD-dependent oxidoreductase [Mycobacterium sp. E2699]|uniref:FAD-dependent oxidoreductase n=1 Tax=Mycobacterium sp. E2699 TaxID=1834137 RepID=UPI000B0FDA00|nr:FAD-dependent oxidoreductase [Mycobacterium sp. E2699]
MKIAIVGAGIAGPTLAYWLRRYGREPTLIEKAPRLRTGGATGVMSRHGRFAW